ALEEERADAPASARRTRPSARRIAVAAAAVIVLVASAGVAAWQSARAAHYDGVAAHYESFLEALGGRDVRVGTLHARGQQDVQGSVVMYDSDEGQSWILVLVRAPGEAGEAAVTVSSPNRRIELRPLQFGATGEASSWLVT